MKPHPLRRLIERHKKGAAIGVYSVCSANAFVLQAAMQQAAQDRALLLIEATSNQVDQFGGYTGMTPQDFKDFVFRLANENNFNTDQLILGGDHLGPNRWQTNDATLAMENARAQIAAYVQAGFSKIHLDPSMPLKGDKTDAQGRLPIEIIAQRTAELCKVAEQAAHSNQNLSFAPLYVIGSDVPPPGGAQHSTSQIHITPVSKVEATLIYTKQAFQQHNLNEAWENVRAIVVQPGVEFDHQQVFEYQSSKAAPLKTFIETQKQWVYEAHSTDYQSPLALRQMVIDHFAILKVGPALTFAMREALFALAFIEQELAQLHRKLVPSNLLNTIEQIMLKEPDHWQKHYHGTAAQKQFARRYSFSDRIRYYWPHPAIQNAVRTLLKNLQQISIPLTLISQYLPEEYQSIRLKKIDNNPQNLILHKIRTRLQDYVFACQHRPTPSLTTTHNQPIMEPI